MNHLLFLLLLISLLFIGTWIITTILLYYNSRKTNTAEFADYLSLLVESGRHRKFLVFSPPSVKNGEGTGGRGDMQISWYYSQGGLQAVFQTDEVDTLIYPFFFTFYTEY